MATYPLKKVLFVDDDPEMHTWMRFLLGEAYDLTCVFSGEDAVAAATSEAFSVVILDLQMKGISGLEALRQLGGNSIAPKVIVLTGQDSKESAIEALNLGVFRYLVKPVEHGDLQESLDAACRRYDFERSALVPPNILDFPAANALTERQLEIAGYAARGETNREIGERLKIKTRTVEKHMERIFSALNVSSRAKLPGRFKV